MNPVYDFIVIGGGSAGYAAAAAAGKLGLRTALVDGGKEIGGLCILRGCMPSKTLIESANRFLTLRRAEEFGLRVEKIAFSGEEIIGRKRRLVAGFADYRRKQIETGPFHFFRGLASFTGTHSIEVRREDGVDYLQGQAFLIATGSTVSRVEIPGLDRVPFLTSDTMLESPAIPDSIIVLGGGAIALEAAHFYSALGVEVTVLQRSAHILSEFDTDVAIALQDALRSREVRILTGTALLRVEMVGEKKRVIFNHENAAKSVEADEILYALGRKPAMASLGLERAGVALPGGQLEVNAFQQTSLQHIYAAGDAIGPFEIVHIAIEQGELAARNAARQVRGHREPFESMDYRLKSFVVFTSPQAASVGLSETEAARANVRVRVAKHPFDDHGKSLVMGETEGFVKLIAEAGSGKILGAAAVGPEASELIHEIIVAMHFHATAADLARIPHYHPTLSEIWTYPAAELS